MDTIEKLEIARGFHSATIRLLRQLRLVDQKLGMSTARLSLMSVLVFKGPCTMSELANIEQVSRPTITNLVKGLERDGYVKCSGTSDDKRAVLATATKKGHRLLEKGQETRVKQLAGMFNDLNDKEIQCLKQAAEIVGGILNQNQTDCQS